MNRSRPTSRRGFLKQSTGAFAGLWIAGSRVRGDEKSPNERLNIGLIGVAGRGASNLKNVSGENIVALCDIDDNRLAPAALQFPAAKTYNDFRKLLEQKGIDAVVVSTPDHTHAVAAAMALRLGKHVYCEKPLTHSIHEARTLARLAAEAKVATQMGNAGHSSENTRRVVELVRAGAIGPVHEVHAWTNRPIWPQGIDRPTEIPPIPAHVHWDLWLGPAPERPYDPAYHPFKWRGWWDFGTGALGDMGCHVFDPPYWALDLRYPSRVTAEGPPRNAETAPPWSIVRYEFPARGGQPPVALTWYDGGKLPPAELFDGELPAKNSSGSVLVEARRGGFAGQSRAWGWQHAPARTRVRRLHAPRADPPPPAQPPSGVDRSVQDRCADRHPLRLRRGPHRDRPARQPRPPLGP